MRCKLVLFATAYLLSRQALMQLAYRYRAQVRPRVISPAPFGGFGEGMSAMMISL